MGRSLAAGLSARNPADRDRERIGARTDGGRDAERHFSDTAKAGNMEISILLLTATFAQTPHGRTV